MPWILVAAFVIAGPNFRPIEVPADQAGTALASTVQTGSLLVSEGDCVAVKVFTGSPYTHVAAVVIRNGDPFVYESANGVGVRCRTLASFLAAQENTEVHIFHPHERFSPSRATQFEKALDSRLGQPYAVMHHMTGERGEGVHCSEYVTDALVECNILRAKQPARVSPASLLQGLLQAELYHETTVVKLAPVCRTVSQDAGWCTRIWLDTKNCTHRCYLKMRGWSCCY